jgi:hypothetical protein
LSEKNQTSTPLAFSIYLFTCQIFLTGSLSAKIEASKLFKESHRILVGEVLVKVLPRREYLIKAGASGELKLNYEQGKIQVEAGDELGGIDIETHQLQQDLLNIEESLLKEKKLPQAQLQRITEIDKFKERLSKIDSELRLTKKFLDNPDLFSQVYDSDQSDEQLIQKLYSTLQDLNVSKKIFQERISYLENEKFQDLEIQEIEKKLKIKNLQFQARDREVRLTVPFSGELQYLYPYQTGERNFVTSGVDIAKVRDINEIYVDSPIYNSKWRLIPKDKLKLVLKSTTGEVVGNYFESREKNISGNAVLVYRFSFPKSKVENLRPMLDGMVDAKLYYAFEKPALLAPKFLLVSLNPVLFKERGWSGLIEELCPGFELIEIGLNQVGIRSKSTEESVSN